MNFSIKLNTLFNILLVTIVSVFSSCKAPSVETLEAKTKYDNIVILSIEKKKTTKVVLFIPDDDSLSVKSQVDFLLPLLSKETSLYAFPKYKYTNVAEKNNADSPELRLELLVAAYQHLVASEQILKSHEVVVLGLGEGSLIAPHFSRITSSDKLYLINAFYHSYKENLTIAYTEKTKNSKDLKSYIGFGYTNEWLSFFEDIEKNKNPDKSAGKRTYRYFSKYWKYSPGKFIGTQTPTAILLFKDYFLSSEYDKNYILNLNQPNISSKLIEGSMFSKFSSVELKKLDWL